MADDTLRLVAKITDEFTGPLGKLKGELKGVGDESRRHAGGWKKDWDDLRSGAEKYRGVLGDFSPVLSKIGVGGLGAALSLGGVAVALEKFAGSTRGLSLMAKDIGLTVDQLRAFNGLGEKFGVSADTMKGAARGFADEMKNIQQHGSDYVQLQAMNLSKLAEELASSKNMEEAIERGLEGLKNIPDPVVRRRVARMLFGTDDIALIASNLTGTAKAALQEVQSQIGSIDKATEEAAKRFENSLSRAGQAFERLKIMALSPVLGGAAIVMDGLADSIETDPNDPKSRLKYLKKQQQDLDGRIAQAPEGSFKRRYFENNREGVNDEIRKLEEAIARGAEKGVDKALGKRGQESPTVQQQSFSGSGSAGGNGSLIQKAAWGSGGFSAGGPLGGSSGGVVSGGAGIFGGAVDRNGPGFGSGGAGRSGPDGAKDADIPRRRQANRPEPEIGDGMRGRPFGSKGAIGGASGPLGKDAPVTDRGMLDLIARAEGTTGRGYNDSFAHQVPGELTGKTLGEIEQIQRRMRGSSAIGRYQFMRGTLFGSGRKGDQGLAGELGLSRDEKFTPELQDRLGNRLIERRYGEAKRNQARHGGDFMRHFRTALAREWASFPGDYGQRGVNGGMYPGQRASIGRDRLTQGAQRWLDEREGRLAGSPAGSGRRPEVLADPGDERRRPDDGPRQTKPWTKAPAIDANPSTAAIPPTRVDMEDDGGMYAGSGALRKGVDQDFWDGLAKDGQAEKLRRSEAVERSRRSGDLRGGFIDEMKRRASRGTPYGHREDETYVPPGGGRYIDELNGHLNPPEGGLSGDAEAQASEVYQGLQRRHSDPAYKPDRELGLDEIRQKYAAPKQKVGDALMDRFYGKGAVGGGPAMQMPGGAAGGGKGTLHIKFDNAPAGMTHRASMDDLFKETNVSKGRPQMDMGRE